MNKTFKVMGFAIIVLFSGFYSLHNNAYAALQHDNSSLSEPGFAANNPKQVFLASSDLDYLPKNVTYDPNIPKPESVLGYPVGTWHVRHDQLIAYMKVLAESSERVSLTVTGRTHEQRELVLLTITSSVNQQKIDVIKSAHQASINNGTAPKPDAPLIINMGYSVHGNEPSGSNASLLVAYYLAAAQGAEVDMLLNNAVILLDPSLNPDGLSRFAQWANMHKGKHPSAHAMHREHAERFPSGRTNHYWFDLNRDWILLTHPESQARIAQFHSWRPHILTDFHEMGTNSTYFFQPGVPSRKNPLTDDNNVVLTNLLGEFHAQALDAHGQMYYTQENFDDFYYGKGSTYPDVHGAVGILFEQASSRGHLQTSINGPLSFAQSIQNQITTSFSTFAGALANKSVFQAHHVNFVKETQALQKDDPVGGYLVQLTTDTKRNAVFIETLNAHQIATQLLTQDITVNDTLYKANEAILVSTNQPQYRLLSSLFSTRQNFPNNTFYDVSNWNIAFAFNLNYATLTKRETQRIKSKKVSTYPYSSDMIDNSVNSHVGYAFRWDESTAPALLYRVLAHGIEARIAAKSFSVKTHNNEIEQFAAGTVIIPAGLRHSHNWEDKLRQLAAHLNIQLFALASGLTPQGIDVGSPSMQVASLPNVMLLGGLGMSQYEVGEIWHYLDTRLTVPTTIVDQDRFGRVNLSDFTHIIIASGRYQGLSDKDLSALKAWVRSGGVVIGTKRGAKFLADNGLLEASVLSKSAIDEQFSSQVLHFAGQADHYAKKLVAGAVYETIVDTSHPLMFGIVESAGAPNTHSNNAKLPMFKTNNMVMNGVDKPFIEVAKYSQSPLLGGYSAQAMQDLIAQSSAIIAHPYGQGRVIGFADNVNFRGYWRGTEKLMANAIFMAPLIKIR